jgi:DUF4097 and DUF4098 domain-containing protein YvlB
MPTFTTPGRTRVVVSNPYDVVEIVGESTDSTTVELIARGTDGDALVGETSVTCAETNGVSVVTVTLPGARSFPKRRSGVDVHVVAPVGADVVVGMAGSERSLLSIARGGTGEVKLRGTLGDVDVALPAADVTAQDVRGGFSVKTASGVISAGTVGGAVRIRSVSGDVDLDEVTDDVSLTVVSGDVSIGAAGRHVDVTSVSGDVTVTDARGGANIKSTSGDVSIRRAWDGTVRAATVSGDVTVGVPPGRGISVDARSMSGELSSEIDLSERASGSDANGSTVKISAHSVSGDVAIQRAAAVA